VHQWLGYVAYVPLLTSGYCYCCCCCGLFHGRDCCTHCHSLYCASTDLILLVLAADVMHCCCPYLLQLEVTLTYLMYLCLSYGAMMLLLMLVSTLTIVVWSPRHLHAVYPHCVIRTIKHDDTSRYGELEHHKIVTEALRMSHVLTPATE
jgi:hypothetical protein